MRGGIPRIVVSATEYTDAFGEQWNKYRSTQLDSYTGTTISRDRLTRCLGEALWQRLNAGAALQLEWAKLDTHDSLTDYYKHLRTPARIWAALAALGADDIWVARGGNGVEARCRKPAQG